MALGLVLESQPNPARYILRSQQRLAQGQKTLFNGLRHARLSDLVGLEENLAFSACLHKGPRLVSRSIVCWMSLYARTVCTTVVDQITGYKMGVRDADAHNFRTQPTLLLMRPDT